MRCTDALTTSAVHQTEAVHAEHQTEGVHVVTFLKAFLRNFETPLLNIDLRKAGAGFVFYSLATPFLHLAWTYGFV